jgi:hypothetical protein
MGICATPVKPRAAASADRSAPIPSLSGSTTCSCCCCAWLPPTDRAVEELQASVRAAAAGAYQPCATSRTHAAQPHSKKCFAASSARRDGPCGCRAAVGPYEIVIGSPGASACSARTVSRRPSNCVTAVGTQLWSSSEASEYTPMPTVTSSTLTACAAALPGDLAGPRSAAPAPAELGGTLSTAFTLCALQATWHRRRRRRSAGMSASGWAGPCAAEAAGLPSSPAARWPPSPA